MFEGNPNVSLRANDRVIVHGVQRGEVRHRGVWQYSFDEGRWTDAPLNIKASGIREVVRLSGKAGEEPRSGQ